MIKIDLVINRMPLSLVSSVKYLTEETMDNGIRCPHCTIENCIFTPQLPRLGSQDITFWPQNSTVLTDLEHLYRIYSNPTRDKHQWLLLEFIVLLMMDAKGVRNMQSILVVVNKYNTARVASCWFIIYILYNQPKSKAPPP